MSDPPKRKTPAPFGVPVVPAIERQSGRSHREHARRPSQNDVDAFEDEDFTEQYEMGEISAAQLEEGRAGRSDDNRLRRAEKNIDQLRRDMQDFRGDVQDDIDGLRAEIGGVRNEVGGVKVAVADMGGQFKVIPDLVGAMKDATSALRQRDHVKFTAEVDVGKARAMDELEAGKAKRADTLDANKAKRDWVTKGIAVVSSVAAIVATAVAAGRC